MRARGARSSDPASQQLTQLAGKVGNQQTADRVQGSASERDQLLAFITERLRTMRGVQLKEREQMGMNNRREWFRPVARGTDGYFLPDTTRWHEAAQTYQRAAEALTRGDLSRGARLIEKATEAERAAFDSVPEQVADTLDTHERTAGATPDAVPHLLGVPTCPTVAMPAELHKLADAILRTQAEIELSPPLATRRRRWWDGEEEEEEEDKDGEGDKK